MPMSRSKEGEQAGNMRGVHLGGQKTTRPATWRTQGVICTHGRGLAMQSPHRCAWMVTARPIAVLQAAHTFATRAKSPAAASWTMTCTRSSAGRATSITNRWRATGSTHQVHTNNVYSQGTVLNRFFNPWLLHWEAIAAHPLASSTYHWALAPPEPQ